MILQVISGPANGTRWRLRDGQAAKIGRTEWADFCVPGDTALAEIHFVLECDVNSCRLRDLSGAGVQINGQASVDAVLRNGDRIAAGRTTFAVQIENGGDSAAAPDKTTAAVATPDAENAAAPRAAPLTAAAVAERIKLTVPARALLTGDLSPEKFCGLLAAQGLMSDALRFTAAWLPKPAAVAWAAGCTRRVIGDQLPVADVAALQAAERWASEPTEEHRRACQTAAEATGHSGPAGWVALAAFWSGGSLAPADSPEVPPDDRLTAQAIHGALLMAATAGDASQATPRQASFLKSALTIPLSALSSDGKP